MNVHAVFVALSGYPVCEAAAVAVSENLDFLSVFHEFSNSPQLDQIASLVVHGFSEIFLTENGCGSVETLMNRLKTWIEECKTPKVYGDANTYYEAKMWGIDMIKTGPGLWPERMKTLAHKVARHLKREEAPIGGRICKVKLAHAEYQWMFFVKNEETKEMRKHGPHCALYDVVEVCLYHCVEKSVGKSSESLTLIDRKG